MLLVDDWILLCAGVSWKQMIGQNGFGIDGDSAAGETMEMMEMMGLDGTPWETMGDDGVG